MARLYVRADGTASITTPRCGRRRRSRLTRDLLGDCFIETPFTSLDGPNCVQLDRGSRRPAMSVTLPLYAGRAASRARDHRLVRHAMPSTARCSPRASRAQYATTRCHRRRAGGSRQARRVSLRSSMLSAARQGRYRSAVGRKGARAGTSSRSRPHAGLRRMHDLRVSLAVRSATQTPQRFEPAPRLCDSVADRTRSRTL